MGGYYNNKELVVIRTKTRADERQKVLDKWESLDRSFSNNNAAMEEFDTWLRTQLDKDGEKVE